MSYALSLGTYWSFRHSLPQQVDHVIPNSMCVKYGVGQLLITNAVVLLCAALHKFHIQGPNWCNNIIYNV